MLGGLCLGKAPLVFRGLGKTGPMTQILGDHSGSVWTLVAVTEAGRDEMSVVYKSTLWPLGQVEAGSPGPGGFSRVAAGI